MNAFTSTKWGELSGSVRNTTGWPLRKDFGRSLRDIVQRVVRTHRGTRTETSSRLDDSLFLLGSRRLILLCTLLYVKLFHWNAWSYGASSIAHSALNISFAVVSRIYPYVIVRSGNGTQHIDTSMRIARISIPCEKFFEWHKPESDKYSSPSPTLSRSPFPPPPAHSLISCKLIHTAVHTLSAESCIVRE